MCLIYGREYVTQRLIQNADINLFFRRRIVVNLFGNLANETSRTISCTYRFFVRIAKDSILTLSRN